MKNEKFLKFLPCEKSFWLLRSFPKAFLLLAHIAEFAQRSLESDEGLLFGDVILGNFREIGLSHKEYRTAMGKLIQYGFIETVWNEKNKAKQKRAIKRAIKREVVNLINFEVWDIRPDDSPSDKNKENTIHEGQTEGQTDPTPKSYAILADKSALKGQTDFGDQGKQNDFQKMFPNEKNAGNVSCSLFFKKQKEKQEKEKVPNPSKLSFVPFSTQKISDEIDGMMAFIEIKEYDISRSFLEIWIQKRGFEYVFANFQVLMNHSKPFTTSAGAWFNTALTKDYAGVKERKEINRKYAQSFKFKMNYKSLKINLTCATDEETGDDFQFSLPVETFTYALKNKFYNKEGII
jgi:hypothetical protein